MNYFVVLFVGFANFVFAYIFDNFNQGVSVKFDSLTILTLYTVNVFRIMFLF